LITAVLQLLFQYHYVKELGPDFEFSDLLGKEEDNGNDKNEH
jgi:hypothetical protein